MAGGLRIGLCVLAGIVGCSSEQERRVVTAPPVATAPVLAIELEDRIEASGELLALQHAEIASEVSGRITQIVLDEGSAAEAGVSVLEIDPERRQLELMTMRAGLVEAQTARVDQRRATERVRELHRRSVASESPTIDVRTRTLRVKAALENQQGRLRPGLFARADLGVSRRSGVLMIPEEAILQRSDGSVVFRLVGEDRVQRQVVELGVFRNGQAEVVSGLDARDHIVTRGHTSLVDGSTVMLRNIDGSPARQPNVATEPRGSSSSD